MQGNISHNVHFLCSLKDFSFKICCITGKLGNVTKEFSFIMYRLLRFMRYILYRCYMLSLMYETIMHILVFFREHNLILLGRLLYDDSNYEIPIFYYPFQFIS